MAEDRNNQHALQEGLEALFSLQAQLSDDHKKFITETTALFKASQQRLNETVEAVNHIEQAIEQSLQLAKEENQAVETYLERAYFWKCFIFCLGIVIFVGLTLLVFFTR